MVKGIKQEIERQSMGVGDITVFWCASCRNYEGALVCKKGVFIAFEGANLSNCHFFDPGEKCSHCGKIT
jgi:hypothetical protein